MFQKDLPFQVLLSMLLGKKTFYKWQAYRAQRAPKHTDGLWLQSAGAQQEHTEMCCGCAQPCLLLSQIAPLLSSGTLTLAHLLLFLFGFPGPDSNPGLMWAAGCCPTHHPAQLLSTVPCQHWGSPLLPAYMSRPTVIAPWCCHTWTAHNPVKGN